MSQVRVTRVYDRLAPVYDLWNAPREWLDLRAKRRLTGVTEPAATVRTPSLRGKLWSAVLAVWGAFTGVLPHVLHHVGPLAGAAILAGAGGRLLFFAIGLVAAIPMLLRLYRRFHTWVAPATAVAIFAAMFTLSTLVIAPLITGSGSDGEAKPQAPGIQMPSGHAAHHK